MKLLVVDDDRDVRELVAFALREDRHTVDTADSALDGAMLALTGDYDAMVLDVRMQDGNGLQVVRRLRREGKTTPVLLLTAQRTAQEVIDGLDAGADDYLTKPFEVDVLKARVRALLRRGGLSSGAAAGTQLALGDLVMDRTHHEVHVAGARLELTPKEFALLELLLLHAGATVPRTKVLDKVWGRSRDPESNVIDALVVRLRARLRDAGARVALETVRGTGYRIVAGPAA